MNDLFSVAPLVVVECLALAALLGAVLASFVGCAVARSLAGQSFLTAAATAIPAAMSWDPSSWFPSFPGCGKRAAAAGAERRSPPAAPSLRG